MTLRSVTYFFESSLSASLTDVVVVDFGKKLVTVTLGNSAPVEHKPVSMPYVPTKQASDYLNAAYQGTL